MPKKKYIAVREFSLIGQNYYKGDEWRGSVAEAQAQVAEGNLKEVENNDDDAAEDAVD